MQAKSWIMLRVLLNRFHGNPDQSLLKYLPEEQAKIVLTQNVDSKDVKPSLMGPRERIKQIHYSWLIPILEQFTEPLRAALIFSLPDPQKKSLAEFFHQKSSSKTIAPPAQDYLAGLLYSKLRHADALPLEYLPQSPLKEVAELNKKELLKLFDYLGLYDLALEFRHIVEKNKLRKITGSLSPQRQKFLRQCLQQKGQIQSQDLNLEAWDGDPAKLNKVLHRRGMIRLGYALSGEHPDLIWHITHTLDTGRAEVLSKHVSPKEIPTVTQSLAQQVLNLIKFLRESGNQ